jgi:hypothetical protein
MSRFSSSELEVISSHPIAPNGLNAIRDYFRARTLERKDVNPSETVDGIVQNEADKCQYISQTQVLADGGKISSSTS